MKRRDYLKTGIAAGLGALAGCTGSTGRNGGTTTTSTTVGTTQDPMAGDLYVGTYQPFIDAPSVSPGGWIKDQFESKYPKATVKWLTPESGLNYFIQRKQSAVTIDADVYVGLNADDLVRIDEKLGDTSLLDSVGTDVIPNAVDVKSELDFDPKNRAIPYDTGIISLVYDGGAVDNPGTFDALATDPYKDTLLVENAQNSDPGKAFLLWTVKTLGEGTYLEYWKRLVDNGAKVVKDWNAAYTAYSNGERPIVVSYSTDQVYANRYDEPMEKHQIGFLNDQGYATPEGMARFADSDRPELAAAFIDFMLSNPVQSKIPVLNVSFPATTTADPPADFAEFAHRPPEVVSHTYQELAGTLDTWVEQWAQQIAGG